jgi:hypothetical protein
MEVSCQFHVPATLYLEKSARNALDGWWLGSRTGLDAMEESLSLLPGIEPQYL